jgi:hypothetical protein
LSHRQIPRVNTAPKTAPQPIYPIRRNSSIIEIVAGFRAERAGRDPLKGCILRSKEAPAMDRG